MCDIHVAAVRSINVHPKLTLCSAQLCTTLMYRVFTRHHGPGRNCHGGGGGGGKPPKNDPHKEKSVEKRPPNIAKFMF